MTKHAVVIAGGGPTGMMLAAELALAKVDVALVERRATQDLPGSRAGGLQARTIEVFDQRGIADRFLAAGTKAQVCSFGGAPLNISDFPTRHNYGLALWQDRIEKIMAGWVAELPVTAYRGVEVVDFAQSDSGVAIALSDARTLAADYLVGCDGGRSIVRKKAGIDFPGWDPSVSFLIADCSLREEAPWGLRRDEKGVYGLSKVDNHVRIVLREDVVKQGDATEAELRALLTSLYGSDFGVHDITWLSRFTDMTRQAAEYRADRILLAGDAAHVHSPTGGQGLNLGVQDAVNLGWKLARVVKGEAPAPLLDTYGAERRPVAARALKATMATTAITRGDARTEALRDAVFDLFEMTEPRKKWAGIMSGLDVHYDLGGGHPLLGRRMPDLDLVTADGPKRVYEYLHDAQDIVFDFGGASDLPPNVRRVTAKYGGTWELPVIGAVQPPAAVHVRPDGYVAWVG